MTREITHMKAFALALESMGKPAFASAESRRRRAWSTSTSTIQPARRPWRDRRPRSLERRQRVGIHGVLPSTNRETDRDSHGKFRTDGWGNDPELLVEQLRDILHAEKQVKRRFPRW